MTAQDWLLVLAALLGVGASVTAMAVGVMMRRPCLRGSCGGTPVLDAQGQRLSCATCPNRARKAEAPAEPPANALANALANERAPR